MGTAFGARRHLECGFHRSEWTFRTTCVSHAATRASRATILLILTRAIEPGNRRRDERRRDAVGREVFSYVSSDSVRDDDEDAERRSGGNEENESATKHNLGVCRGREWDRPFRYISGRLRRTGSMNGVNCILWWNRPRPSSLFSLSFTTGHRWTAPRCRQRACMRRADSSSMIPPSLLVRVCTEGLQKG